MLTDKKEQLEILAKELLKKEIIFQSDLEGLIGERPFDKQTTYEAFTNNNGYLTIEADGAVSYQRREGAKSTTINAPLKGFKGDDFIVGIGPFDTTFVVSQPPQMTAEGWRMTVDGVELYK